MAVNYQYQDGPDMKSKMAPMSDIMSDNQDAITNRVTDHDHGDDGERLIEQHYLIEKEKFDGRAELLQMPADPVNY